MVLDYIEANGKIEFLGQHLQDHGVSSSPTVPRYVWPDTPKSNCEAFSRRMPRCRGTYASLNCGQFILSTRTYWCEGWDLAYKCFWKFNLKNCITEYLHIPAVNLNNIVLTEMLKNCFSSISESSEITANNFVSVDNSSNCLAMLKISLWFSDDVLVMTMRQWLCWNTWFVILWIHRSYLPYPEVSEVFGYATECEKLVIHLNIKA